MIGRGVPKKMALSAKFNSPSLLTQEGLERKVYIKELYVVMMITFITFKSQFIRFYYSIFIVQKGPKMEKVPSLQLRDKVCTIPSTHYCNFPIL